MTAKEKLTDEILNMLLSEGCLTQQIKQKLCVVMNAYNITEGTTEVTLYDDTNDAILKQFAISKRVSGRSEKTISIYTWTLKKFFDSCGKKVTDITGNDIKYYLAKRMTKGGVSDTTLKNELKYLKAFFDWCLNNEIVRRNPAAQVESIKVAKQHKEAFSEIECEKIRRACKTEKEKCIVELLFSTACRCSELISIKTQDIDGKRIIIHGKGNKYAPVYLESKAMLAVEAYVNGRTDNNPYLLPSRIAGEHMTAKGLETLIHRIGDRAGIADCHPHRFRRTAATLALRRGMPIEMVSKMLRHENINTTQVYLDISENELMQIHEKYVV